MRALLFILCLASAQTLIAEPWLGTHFAQNCASCHAPGRRPVAAREQRCTLTCKGCHVNPNGGGLRNFYGKWTENQWLKTFRIEAIHSEKTTAPLKEQAYAKPAADPAALAAAAKTGLPLVRTAEDDPDEERYNVKANTLSETSNADEIAYNIPAEDPFRQFMMSKVSGGADFRFALQKRTTGTTTEKKPKAWLMSADLGIEWRPLYRNLHFVYETRFLGKESASSLDATLISKEGLVRDLYVLADNLPYNSFVMTGYYKPLFGNNSADDTALSQILLGQMFHQPANTLRFRAASVGASPGIPYANLHYIDKDLGGGTKDRTRGVAANLGVHLVPFGATAAYSFWYTDNLNDSDHDIKILMHAISISGNLIDKHLIISGEAISMERDDRKNDYRRGGLTTLETKWRLWRENYLLGDFAFANTDETLAPGSAKQAKYGVKSFLFPGVEWSLSFNKDAFRTAGTATRNSKYFYSNLHLYF